MCRWDEPPCKWLRPNQLLARSLTGTHCWVREFGAGRRQGHGSPWHQLMLCCNHCCSSVVSTMAYSTMARCPCTASRHYASCRHSFSFFLSFPWIAFWLGIFHTRASSLGSTTNCSFLVSSADDSPLQRLDFSAFDKHLTQYYPQLCGLHTQQN